MGEEIELSTTGEKMRRRTPYDFVAITEHSEYCGGVGHGGLPNMIFRGEPDFGQDRFDHLFFRLRQNGLTMRDEPIWPPVTKPIRWPDGI